MRLRHPGSPADDHDVPRCLQQIAAASIGIVTLSACGGERARSLDVRYDGECVIEMEFERRAKQPAVAAFVHRVERAPHVERTQVLSRTGNIARFRDAIREEGHTGEDYIRLMTRARRHAGRVLLVKADDDRHVFAIIDRLGGLPAGITSVAERVSCPRRT